MHSVSVQCHVAWTHAIVNASHVKVCLWSSLPLGCLENDLCPGGLWAGDWLMKALAIATEHNIITIAANSMFLYCCAAPHEQDGYGVTAMRPYPATYAKVQRDLPLEALDNNTWYLIFDGGIHYWPAIRTNDAPSRADVEQAGLILHESSSKPISDAVSTRRRVRIQQPV